jgi:hypothetical protein
VPGFRLGTVEVLHKVKVIMAITVDVTEINTECRGNLSDARQWLEAELGVAVIDQDTAAQFTGGKLLGFREFLW